MSDTINALKDFELQDLYKLLESLEYRSKYYHIDEVFTDEGKFSRANYAKHVQFFDAGADHQIRALIAGNRSGKTYSGFSEATYHCCKLYKHWWKGRKFDHPPVIWICGKTAQNVRDYLQPKLLGRGEPGTGLIPKERIKDITLRSKPSGSVDKITVYWGGDKDNYQGVSEIIFKFYDQGVEAFESGEADLIILDEECPLDIFGECVIRAMVPTKGTKPGSIVMTFTPKKGLTPTVLHILPDGQFPDNNVTPAGIYVQHISMDEVPHLDKETIETVMQQTPMYLRDAVRHGIPSIGSGRIFTASEDMIMYDPEVTKIGFEWPRAFAFDYGQTRSAAIWAAKDPVSKVVYIYAEQEFAYATLPTIAWGLKAKGNWIPGVGDCYQLLGDDRIQVLDQLVEMDVNIYPIGQKNTEASIAKAETLLNTGQVRISKALVKLWSEYRRYSRDEAGRIIKNTSCRTDFIDCFRYLLWAFEDIADTYKEPREEQENASRQEGNRYSWI